MSTNANAGTPQHRHCPLDYRQPMNQSNQIKSSGGRRALTSTWCPLGTLRETVQLSLSARRSSATRLSSCQQRVDASKSKPPNLTKQQTLQPQYLKGVVPLLYTPTIENGPCHSISLPDNCLRFPFEEYTIEKRERREDRDPNMATTTTVTIRTAIIYSGIHAAMCISTNTGGTQ